MYRYRTCGEAAGVDGLTGDEGTFFLCAFWLVDGLALTGRLDEARALFERLLALRNDFGLLAEEYDPVQQRQLGNFPQAFSHMGLIQSALLLQQMMTQSSRRQGVVAVPAPRSASRSTRQSAADLTPPARLATHPLTRISIPATRLHASRGTSEPPPDPERFRYLNLRAA